MWYIDEVAGRYLVFIRLGASIDLLEDIRLCSIELDYCARGTDQQGRSYRVYNIRPSNLLWTMERLEASGLEYNKTWADAFNKHEQVINYSGGRGYRTHVPHTCPTRHLIGPWSGERKNHEQRAAYPHDAGGHAAIKVATESETFNEAYGNIRAELDDGRYIARVCRD